MAFLTVAGIDVRVVSGSEDPTETGDRAPAIDGTMRGAIIATKRIWTVTTGNMAPSDAATLRTTLLANPKCTATGDWLNGDSITVWPKVGKDTPVDTVPFCVQMNFTLTEA